MKTFYSDKPESILYMKQANGIADVWLRKHIEPYEVEEGEIVSTGWQADEKYIQTTASYDEVVVNFDYFYNQDEREKDKEKMEQLKRLLESWDYKTSKYVDGEYSNEEWAVIANERRAIREQIRALEDE